MALKRWDGKKSKQDGTTILRILDNGGVLREIKQGESIDLNDVQIAALSKRYVFNESSDPTPTAPIVSAPLMSVEFIGLDGKVKPALLGSESQGAILPPVANASALPDVTSGHPICLVTSEMLMYGWTGTNWTTLTT